MDSRGSYTVGPVMWVSPFMTRMSRRWQPDPPRVSANADSETSLDVSWTAPNNQGRPRIRSYDLQYREGNTGDFTDGPQNVTGKDAVIADLDPDTTYEVRVRATNKRATANGRRTARQPRRRASP